MVSNSYSCHRNRAHSVYSIILFAICFGGIGCTIPIGPDCKASFSECAQLPTVPRNPTRELCESFAQSVEERLACMIDRCESECAENPRVCSIASAGAILMGSGAFSKMPAIDADAVVDKLIEGAIGPRSDAKFAEGEPPRVPPELKQECERIRDMRRACSALGITVPCPGICKEIGVNCDQLSGSIAEQNSSIAKDSNWEDPSPKGEN